jgi:thiol-disulfide isomerase/thioredoxin
MKPTDPPDPSAPSAPRGQEPPAAPVAAPARPRRRLLLAGVGAGAALAGVAGSLWWQRPAPTAADDPADDPAAALWPLRFERPEGGQLVMAELRGRPLVVNFWAPWCPPCVREMPELDRFHREFAPRGWQVVGLAVDNLAPVRDFLQRIPVGFPIGMAGFAGIEIGRALGNTAGALPFTVLLASDGRIAQRKLGETTHAELAALAAAIR